MLKKEIRMKRIARYAASAALLSLMLPAMFACTSTEGPKETEPPVSDSAAPDTTVPVDDGTVTLGGLKFVLGGGAKFENGVISGTKGAQDNVAVCEDVGTMSVCIDITAKLAGTTTGGISFKYKDDDHRYFLSFDKRNSRVRLTHYNGLDISVVGTHTVDFDKDPEVKIRIAFHNTTLKVFINEISEDAWPAFDVPMKTYRNKGFKLDCGSGTLSFSSVECSEYVYSLTGVKKYTNPVATGADPFILYWEGTYYLYSTNAPNDGYKVFTSTDLVNWTDRGFCLRNGAVYGSPTPSGGYWAPEVYHIDGRFYMFYTVSENIGVAVADSPLGPFKKYSEGFLFPGKRAIDANLFIDDDGQMYLYYVIANNGNDIYGAKFDFKTLTVSDEKLIISPTPNTWEYIGNAGRVAEGPCMIKHNGYYYLTYSANGYPSHDYAIGCAVASSPLGDFERYEDNPILSKSPALDVYGPGHHSMFYTPGGELIMVYHRHKSETEVHGRTTCIDRCRFVPQENGPDKLEVCGPTSTPQRLPE